MNALGIHALVWTGSWAEAEARRAFELTKEAGFDLLEIPLLDPWPVDGAMTRRLLEEHALGAACSLGLPFDADVSSAGHAIAARGEHGLDLARSARAFLQAQLSEATKS